MQWNSISEFFAMGGYAFYVWGSFGLTALALVGEMWLIRQRRLHTLQTLRNDILDETTAS